jgi:hypothetical protein
VDLQLRREPRALPTLCLNSSRNELGRVHHGRHRAARLPVPPGDTRAPYRLTARLSRPSSVTRRCENEFRRRSLTLLRLSTSDSEPSYPVDKFARHGSSRRRFRPRDGRHRVRRRTCEQAMSWSATS